ELVRLAVRFWLSAPLNVSTELIALQQSSGNLFTPLRSMLSRWATLWLCSARHAQTELLRPPRFNPVVFTCQAQHRSLSPAQSKGQNLLLAVLWLAVSRSI